MCRVERCGTQFGMFISWTVNFFLDLAEMDLRNEPFRPVHGGSLGPIHLVWGPVLVSSDRTGGDGWACKFGVRWERFGMWVGRFGVHAETYNG